MPAPADIDQIALEILADMPLKEKAAIANLDEDEVPDLQQETYRITSLVKSCNFL